MKRPSAINVLLVTLSFANAVRAEQPATAADSPVPAAWLNALKEEPKDPIDAQIKAAIQDYEARIAKLKSDDPLVKASLPSLRDNLAVLYQEYNKDKKRYPADHFAPDACLASLQADMKRYLDSSLEQGSDPTAVFAGKSVRKTCWVGTQLMAHYDVIVPRAYDPKKAWPVIFSFQDNPDDKYTRTTDYFLVRAIQKGYPKSFVHLERKTQAILEDVALDFNIDPARVYGTGFSYGGHTSLVFAWRNPHMFAAILAICNDLRDKNAPNVKYIRTPTLLLHGENDSFLQTGKKIHEWMTEAKCPVEWGTYPGGHDPEVPFRKEPKMVTEFFDKHKLDPFPKTLTKFVEHPRYSRCFWADCKLIKNSPCAATYDVAIKENNRIEVNASEEIASLDLFLNAKLVDMSKPVTVVAGEKTLFEGPAAAKLTIKLRDGEDYKAADNTPLPERMAAIRAKAGFAPISAE
jgi:dienelactone hydrolase